MTDPRIHAQQNVAADLARRHQEAVVLAGGSAVPGTARAIVAERVAARMLAQEKADRVAVARWRARQAAMRAHDRKVRRFMLGFGVVVGLAVVAAAVAISYAVYRLFDGMDFGLLGLPLIVVLLVLFGLGGHRCVTIVQHWH